MLILFPPGLLLTSFVFNVIYLIMDNDRFLGGRLLDCRRCDRGLAAAVFGLIGWPDMPFRPRRVPPLRPDNAEPHNEEKGLAGVVAVGRAGALGGGGMGAVVVLDTLIPLANAGGKC